MGSIGRALKGKYEIEVPRIESISHSQGHWVKINRRQLIVVGVQYIIHVE